MQLTSIYANGRFGLSFELFPPRTARGEAVLFDHLDRLMEFRPDFVTCTYGAGGSTRDRTLDVVERVKRTHRLPVASHLTCVGSTVHELREYLATAWQRRIDYIVAVRGDPPRGQRAFQCPPGGLGHANELVELIRAEFPGFGVAVAGYPEVHQEAPSAEVDLQNLKRKVEAGADIVITQLFYNNDDFFRFRERCESIGIAAPVVPGILPVVTLSQIRRLTSLCGASLPAGLVAELGRSDQADWQFGVGVDFAVRQVQELINGGVPGLHFYVLNKSQAAGAVLKAVSRPR
jgi:methylenetetrahydrofolate reductase (NADPH)